MGGKLPLPIVVPLVFFLRIAVTSLTACLGLTFSGIGAFLKLSAWYQGRSRCGKAAKRMKVCFYKEVSPKQAFIACDGGAENASLRDAAPDSCGTEVEIQTVRVSICERQRIGNAGSAPKFCRRA